MNLTTTEYAASAGSIGSSAFDGTSVWSGHQFGGNITLIQVNPTTGAVLNTYVVAGPGNASSPGYMVFAGGFLWFLDDDQYINKIDPATGALLNSFTVEAPVVANGTIGRGLATDGTSLYIVYQFTTAGLVFQSKICKMAFDGTVAWATLVDTISDGFQCVYDGTQLWTLGRNGTHSVYAVSLAGAVTNTIVVAPENNGINPLIFDSVSGQILTVDGNGKGFAINPSTYVLTAGIFQVPNTRFPYWMQNDPSGNIWVLNQDALSPIPTNIFYLDIFDKNGNLLFDQQLDLTDSGGSMTYDSISKRMWMPAFGPTSNEVMLAGGLSKGPMIFDPNTLPVVPLPFCIKNC